MNSVLAEFYEDKSLLKKAVVKYCKPFKIKRSDLKGFLAVCSEEECHFCVKYNFAKRESKYIRKETLEHTCVSNNTNIRSDNIVSLATDLFTNAPEIRTVNIQNVSRSTGGLNITYHQGYKALRKLKKDIEENERKSVRKIKNWLEWQKEKNPGTHISYFEKVDLSDNIRKFESCFFSTSYIKDALAYTLPVITLDACHTKGAYKGIIYTATAITGNNNAFTLAIGLAPTESYYYWKRFLNDLKSCIEISEYQNLVIISDREKGLALSLSEEFPLAHHPFCVFHIEKNIKVRFKKDTTDLLWKSAKALTVADLEKYMCRIGTDVDMAIEGYFREIPAAKWATAHFPVPRYGHC